MTAPLPFAGFISHLQRLGFTIGVEHHLRLHAILNQVGPQHAPQDLKTLLCPLFATDKEQQQQFYEAFDSYFKSWTQVQAAVEEQQEQVEILRRPARRQGWKVGLALVLWGIFALLAWRAYPDARALYREYFVPPPPAPAPVAQPVTTPKPVVQTPPPADS